jgi:alkylation response protein AidB-like acyl-CoA dehydrogenase
VLLDEALQERVEQLDLTPEQARVLRKVRELGRTRIGPAARRVDEEADYPYEAVEALVEAGLTALAVPAAYGGAGAGYGGDVVLLPLVLMEIASWCSSASQVLALHNSAVQYIHALGTEEQKRYFFGEVTEGRLFGSFGSEDHARVPRVRSSLTRVEGGYLLNGTKKFATGSPAAKWAFWHSILAEEAHLDQPKLLMPVVELAADGVTIHGDWDGIGQRGTGSGTVTAQNVFVPDFQVIGYPGAFTDLQTFFGAQFNVHFAAQFTGIAFGAYREALHYVREKLARGGTGADSVLALRLGELSAKLTAARQLVLHAARVLEASRTDEVLVTAAAVAASEAKIVTTDIALQVTTDIFQVMGARSATKAHGFDRFYRNARTLTLHDPVDQHRINVGMLQLKQK